MNASVIGLGKLGLPVAVAMSLKHKIYGYDINPSLMHKHKYQYVEKGPTLKDDFQECLNNSNLHFASLKEAVENSEIIFVAVQTPHLPMYEGTTRIPNKREDFNYTYLIKSIEEIAKYVKPHQTIAVISTVLPGTMSRHVLPLLNGKCHFAYNPHFAAMTSVMHDFLNPEFVLLGGEDTEALKVIKEFYREIYGEDKTVCMSVESAELTKVVYNTYVTTKVTLANLIAEIAHKIPGCNADDITFALSKATNRLVSTRYMQGGMGDGGACHPRDNIAMSWLAAQVDLSHNWFDDIMMAREAHAEWLVKVMMDYDLPKVILGKAFKAETNIVTGSPALLCANILEEYGKEYIIYDPHVDDDKPEFEPSVFLIATKHSCFEDFDFPVGSIVIDPHRYIKEKEGIRLISIGKRVF